MQVCDKCVITQKEKPCKLQITLGGWHLEKTRTEWKFDICKQCQKELANAFKILFETYGCKL